MFNQTSGTIQLTQRGSGTVNVSGTASVSVPGISMGWTTGSSAGTVNLNGGSLTVGAGNIAGGTGTSTFNFNGGTLKAGTSNAAFMQGFTTANVRNSGAIIDTNGFSPTIGQALLHSSIGGDSATDGGLIKQGVGTLTLKGANTFTGATSVNGGTLSLDYSGGDTSKLADGAALNLSGGTVSLTGSSYTEVVGSTTLNVGASSVVRAASSNVLQMGAITHNAGGAGQFQRGQHRHHHHRTQQRPPGPWATVGSGSSTGSPPRAATTSWPTPGSAAAGVDDFVSAAANYEYSLSGGTDSLTASRTANGVRYSGTGETVDLGASGSNTLTLNALVNAGSGTLTLARTGGYGSLVAGSSGELLLNAANASIAVSAPVSGSGLVVASGAGANTVASAAPTPIPAGLHSRPAPRPGRRVGPWHRRADDHRRRDQQLGRQSGQHRQQRAKLERQLHLHRQQCVESGYRRSHLEHHADRDRHRQHPDRRRPHLRQLRPHLERDDGIPGPQRNRAQHLHRPDEHQRRRHHLQRDPPAGPVQIPECRGGPGQHHDGQQ
ncbi:MAG: autotransporter-associated beta strand repeat-containing protein [Kiritimatiellia bacterium]